MELSSKVEYALLALLELSNHRLKGKPLKVNEIAAIQSLPERYLDQIMIVLRKHGIVQSQRGVKGGYLLAKEPDSITLWEIVTVLEGNNHGYTTEGMDTIAIEKTALMMVWQQASQACHSVLESYTLADLCQQRDALQQGDPMYYI